jgi:hypothetical protein
MRSTDQEPNYEFEWLKIPVWILIIAIILISGVEW